MFEGLRSRVPAGLWMLLPVLIILVVWQQASMDRLLVRLENEKDLHRGLESQVNALSLEASRLSSLGQVEARAEKELGLLRPDTQQIVDLVFPGAREHDRSFALQPLVGDAVASPSKQVRPQ